MKSVQTSCRIAVPGISTGNVENVPSNYLRDKKIAPDAEAPSMEDVNLLYQFFDQRSIPNIYVYVV